MEIDVFFSNVYYKGVIAIIMCLILAFAGKIRILASTYILFSIGLALFLMIIFNVYVDIGIILLLLALFILSFNMNTNKIKTN